MAAGLETRDTVPRWREKSPLQLCPTAPPLGFSCNPVVGIVSQQSFVGLNFTFDGSQDWVIA